MEAADMEIENHLPGGEVEKSLSDFSGGENAKSMPPPDAPCASTSPDGGGDIVQIARSWIGTPYVHQASVKGAGCDCLGLLRGVWREVRGAEPEDPPAYSPDWAEASGSETLYMALARHLTEIGVQSLAPGDVALFRMARTGPAKHCGIIALKQRSDSATNKTGRDGAQTLIHARQNHRVGEEPFSPFWRSRLAYAFRM
jgi:NlpC/P60 family putative phage cell wall peptidase